MKPTIKKLLLKTRRLLPMLMAVASLTATARAAAPGITGPIFTLYRRPGLPDPARWTIPLLVGLWL